MLPVPSITAHPSEPPPQQGQRDQTGLIQYTLQLSRSLLSASCKVCKERALSLKSNLQSSILSAKPEKICILLRKK